MKTKNFLTTCLLLSVLTLQGLQAQTIAAEEAEDHSYKPLTLKLNEDGSKYVRFIMWHQLWVNTNNLSDDDANLQLTTSIRRSRFLAYAQISSRFLLLTHWGLNSLNPTNLSTLGNNSNAPQLFLHDAWGEVKLTDQIYVGAGLHYWKGLTRLASQSTLNFMTLDQHRPFYQWHSLGVTDQFARHLGVYAKGQVGKLDYRISWNNPGRSSLGDGIDFSGAFNESGTPQSDLTYTGVRQVNSDGDAVGNSIFEGYFRYNLWDKESTKLPYNVGSYLGKKKVLALGAGFFLHPNGMYNNAEGEHESVSHFAVDAFLDMPTGNGGALNAYASFVSYNYGENYISRWGGTGSVLYGQVGYLIGQSKFMPYVAYSTANFDGAEDPISGLDIGVNYFINGHFAKVTAEYHMISKDYREGAISFDPNGTDNLTQFRLQLHIFL
jgi:hypothetical protein